MAAAGVRGESGENEVRDPMEVYRHLAKNPRAREIGGSLCRVLEIRSGYRTGVFPE